MKSDQQSIPEEEKHDDVHGDNDVFEHNAVGIKKSRPAISSVQRITTL